MNNPTEQSENNSKLSHMEKLIMDECAKFTRKETSAKAIRELFKSINGAEQMKLLDIIYAKEARRENMLRLPPKILIPQMPDLELEEDFRVELLGKIAQYDLIREYEQSKTKQRFNRFRNVINKWRKTWFKDMKINPIYLESIDRIAVNGFINDLMGRDEDQNVETLGLPSSLTIGVELEFVGISLEELLELRETLKRYGITYLDSFEIKNDNSVKEKSKNPLYSKPGVEVTPTNKSIFEDTEESWRRLNKACRFIQAVGGRTNKTCGGHIHIGADILGYDKGAWQTFLSIWKEAEPIIYKMSNRRGEETRNNARKYASMQGEKIGEIDWSSVLIRSEYDIADLATKMQARKNIYGRDYTDRYTSINLNNLILRERKTIEFRLPNGTIDYNILRENILLFGRLLQMAKIHSVDPNRKKEEYEAFFEKNIPEEEKASRFLDLVFDREDEKQIFYKRWESKKNNYEKFKNTIREEPPAPRRRIYR